MKKNRRHVKMLLTRDKWSANTNRNAQQPGCMFETQ